MKEKNVKHIYNRGRVLKKDMQSTEKARPELVLVQSVNYSFRKKINSLIYKRINDQSALFHVWLDCLYEENVSYQDVLKELQPVLMYFGTPNISDIFIIAEELDTVRPAGSCYILFRTARYKMQTLLRTIFEVGIHMIQVNPIALVEHMKLKPILVYSVAHLENLTSVSLEHLYAARRLPYTGKSGREEGSGQQKSTLPKHDVGKEPSKNGIESTTPKFSTLPENSEDHILQPQQQSIDHLEENSDNIAKVGLYKIGSKSRATDILKKFNEDSHMYLYFRIEGTFPVSPIFLTHVFSCFELKFQDLFVLSHNGSRMTGHLALPTNKVQLVKNYLNFHETFMKGEDFLVQISPMRYIDFKSSIMSVTCTSEFRLPTTDTESQVTLSVLKCDNGAASSISNSSKRKKPPKASKNRKPQLSEDELASKLEDSIKRNDFVSDIMSRIRIFGSTVLSLENIPSEISIHTLNLMLGTVSIRSDQVVAVKTPNKNCIENLSLLVVMDPNNPDKQAILAKNKCKTNCNCTIIARQTGFAELEKFLQKHYTKIIRLDTEYKLPITVTDNQL